MVSRPQIERVEMIMPLGLSVFDPGDLLGRYTLRWASGQR